jgi:hypothetical protein
MPVPISEVVERRGRSVHHSSTATADTQATSAAQTIITECSMQSSVPTNGAPAAGILPLALIAWSERAREWNNYAHDPSTSSRMRSFAFRKKNLWLGRIIRSFPELIDVGDTRDLHLGILGISFGRAGALHTRVADLDAVSAEIILRKLVAALKVRATVNMIRRTNTAGRRRPAMVAS